MSHKIKNNSTESTEDRRPLLSTSGSKKEDSPILMKRKRFLMRAAEMGALIIASPLSINSISRAFFFQRHLHPTPSNDLGPFYKRGAPHRKVMRTPGDPGLPLKISGKVFSEKGYELPDATLEIWQTNAGGIYDTVGDHYRAALIANPKGKYELESVMPGHYPARVCQHVHYLVRAEGHKPLVTQLYFATDPVFEGNPDKNYHRDPLITSRELVRPVTIAGEPSSISAKVNFNLVLEKL